MSVILIRFRLESSFAAFTIFAVFAVFITVYTFLTQNVCCCQQAFFQKVFDTHTCCVYGVRHHEAETGTRKSRSY